MLPLSSATFASTTSATLIAAFPSMTTFQTTSTASSGLDWNTIWMPSPMSRQWPRLSTFPA